MLRHIVLFQLSPDATDEAIDAAVAALRALPEAIAEIRDLHVGRDAEIVEGNADLGLEVVFDDAAAWRTYQGHPTHQQVIAQHMRAIVADRTAIQFTD
jgi:hypothetical protein